MIVILEISTPCQPRPGFYWSRIMYRAWWLWFAIALLRISLKNYTEESATWDYPERSQHER